jgi:LysR family transcriptional regulator, glycine cleavage system transcriptional activator
MAVEKMPLLPPLHALRAFDAAARYGRFRDAAKALGLSESAVSHQVKKLEDYLSVSLFERSGNAVALTTAGRRYFEQIEPAFARIRSATEDLKGPLDRSRVAVTLPGTLATFWLIPKLPRLEARHPDISLQLVTTERLSDLRREQIHLAIRYGRAPWPGVVAEHLLDEQAFPVCKPGFVPAELAGRPGDALRKLRLIVNDTHVPEWQEWARGHGLEPPSLRGAIMLHASDQVLGAAIEGLGLAIGRRPLVDQWLNEGRLVAPFGAADLSGAAYYLAWPDDIELPVAARKVAHWLHDMAKAQAKPAAPRQA